jgi:hypothetical protein
MAELKTVSFKDPSGHVKRRLEIDGKPVLVGWESFTGHYWFGIEINETRTVGVGGGGSIMDDGREVNDRIWFGLVQAQEEEYGYCSEAELRSMPGRVWPIRPCDLASSGQRPFRGR